MRSLRLALLAATSLVAAGIADAAPQPTIGATSLIKNQVSGTVGQTKRVLKLGDRVFQNELIATGQISSAQILFADETVLNMGSNSEVSLDKFVYDPANKKGQLSIRAVSGAFRFVSGSGPKEGYRINTPAGSIGVRGTVLEFVIRGNTMMLGLTVGAATLCTFSGKCVHLTVPGTYVVSTGDSTGDTKSKYGRDCGAGGVKCAFGEGPDSLYLDYLGLFRFQGDITAPTFQPPTAPGPGNGPTAPAGFPPVVTGAGTVPPGLAGRATLPPGLVNNRGTNFAPPGHTKNGK